MAVYIIQGCITKHVKVGFSDNVEQRLQTLASTLSEDFDVLAIYPEHGMEVEHWYHQRFDEQRLHGEWFKCEGAVLRTVLNIKNNQNRARLTLENICHA